MKWQQRRNNLAYGSYGPRSACSWGCDAVLLQFKLMPKCTSSYLCCSKMMRILRFRTVTITTLMMRKTADRHSNCLGTSSISITLRPRSGVASSRLSFCSISCGPLWLSSSMIHSTTTMTLRSTLSLSISLSTHYGWSPFSSIWIRSTFSWRLSLSKIRWAPTSIVHSWFQTWSSSSVCSSLSQLMSLSSPSTSNCSECSTSTTRSIRSTFVSIGLPQGASESLRSGSWFSSSSSSLC